MTDEVKPTHSNTKTIVQYPKDSHMAGGVPPLNSAAVCQQPMYDAKHTANVEVHLLNSAPAE